VKIDHVRGILLRLFILGLGYKNLNYNIKLLQIHFFYLWGAVTPSSLGMLVTVGSIIPDLDDR
jgi:hypothetical protein